MTEFPPKNHKEYLQRNLFTLPYSPASTADTITLKHCRVDRGTFSCAQLLVQISKNWSVAFLEYSLLGLKLTMCLYHVSLHASVPQVNRLGSVSALSL